MDKFIRPLHLRRQKTIPNLQEKVGAGLESINLLFSGSTFSSERSDPELAGPTIAPLGYYCSINIHYGRMIRNAGWRCSYRMSDSRLTCFPFRNHLCGERCDPE